MRLSVSVIKMPVPGAVEVVSLAAGERGKIYGGVTGAKGHLLFEYDPKTGRARDLGRLVRSGTQIVRRDGRKVEQKIHKSLFALPDSRILGATGQNIVVMDPDYRMEDDEGGHVFVYDPASGSCSDLAVPVPHEWIINCTVSPDLRYAYGMTYPLNHVFQVDMKSGQARILGQVHGQTTADSACSHECICDREGNLYGSCWRGQVFRYDLEEDTLRETELSLPGGDLRIDSLAVEKRSGMIYGGTWEGGHLFRLDPNAMSIELLGTPHRGPRLPALRFSKDGILYGAAGGGFQYKTRSAFLFRYDPASNELTEIGDIVADGSGIRGQRMHTMAMGKDGRIYLGETGMMTGEAGEVGLNPYVFVCRVED